MAQAMGISGALVHTAALPIARHGGSERRLFGPLGDHQSWDSIGAEGLIVVVVAAW